MRLVWPIFLLALVGFVSANWLPEDYEIFSLNDKVRKDLGAETTFYSWLGLQKGPKLTPDEIAKAYRQLSRKLHPDKLRKGSKSVKKLAEQRFQRLSLVGNILKDRSLKRRYDYYLDKGFPKWKGTGYYYHQFRPGVLLTIIILYLIVSTFHYISLRISRQQDFKRLKSLKDELTLLAWGDSCIPPLDGSDRRVRAPLGKEFHVSSVGEVSLVETDNDGNTHLTLLDENDINVNPGIKESYFYTLPCGLWNFTLGRIPGLAIDTTVPVTNLKRRQPRKSEDNKTSKKTNSNKKGEKIELPNGKVIYSRKKGKK